MAALIRPLDVVERTVPVPAARQRLRQRGTQDAAGHGEEPHSTGVVPAPSDSREEDSVRQFTNELTHMSTVAAATLAGEPGGARMHAATAAAALEVELRQAREEASRAGYAEGLNQAKTDVLAEWNVKFKQLEALTASLGQARHELIEQSEDSIVELVFESVTRILGTSLSSREGVLASVRRVMDQARERDEALTVRLSPADHELLGEEGIAQLVATGDGRVRILSDERVDIGGYLLETPQGNLDGRLEIQLERLKDALLDARASPRE